MNGLAASCNEVSALAAALKRTPSPARVLLCPPASLLHALRPIVKDSPILLGGQDCHYAPSGAHTGDISAEMLADAGANAVLLGHSERRAAYGETGALLRQKLAAARRAGLMPILCAGENAEEAKAGKSKEIVARQLEETLRGSDNAPIIIAYEPVWAIGTGRVPQAEEITAMHAHIAECASQHQLDEVLVLYGGSVNPANAAAILQLAGVGGALVGGASLKSDDFLAIIRSCPSKTGPMS